ncbi:MAG: carbohydrate kinase [Chlorobi bacterium]|nr:carbohydrate kinase [Chlorobiota bacterium]
MVQFNNKKILCFGEVLWDMLPTGPKPGGAPMNVAAHLQKAGQDVSIISRIGKDKEGEELILFLKRSGLRTNLIQEDDKLPTSKVLVHLDGQNNATYEICRPVAWDSITVTESNLEEAGKSGLIIFGTLASRGDVTRQSLLKLIESGAIKLIDVNLRPPYDRQEVVEELLFKADIAKLNDEELAKIGAWHYCIAEEKELMAWMARHYGINMICVTRGADGAILYHEGAFYEHSGFKVNTVDTVGAGDAFLAGFVASIINGRAPDESLEFACATGAFVASKEGAVPNYHPDEIKLLMK